MDKPAFVGYFTVTVTNYVFGIFALSLPLWSGFSTAGDVTVKGHQGLWTRCFYNGSFTCCGKTDVQYLSRYYIYSDWIYGVQILLGITVTTGIFPVLLTMRSGVPSFIAAICHLINGLLTVTGCVVFAIGIQNETWIADNTYHLCFYLTIFSVVMSVGLGITNLYNYLRDTDDKNIPTIQNHFQCPPDYCYGWDVKKTGFTIVLVCYVLQCIASYLPVWSHTTGPDGSVTGYKGLIAKCLYSGEFTCCGILSLQDTADSALKAQAGIGAVWFAEVMAICTGLLTVALMRRTMFLSVTRKGTFAIIISSSITVMSLVVCMAGYATIAKETLGLSFYVTLLSTVSFLGVVIIAFLTNRRKASLKCVLCDL